MGDNHDEIEKLTLRNKQRKEKWKTKEAKAIKCKAIAGKVRSRTKVIFVESIRKRLYNPPPKSSKDLDSETDFESENDISPSPPMKKAKVNQVAAARRCVETKQPIQAKPKEIVDISSDWSSSGERFLIGKRSSSPTSSPRRSSSPQWCASLTHPGVRVEWLLGIHCVSAGTSIVFIASAFLYNFPSVTLPASSSL
jgi:hypothetical protein